MKAYIAAILKNVPDAKCAVNEETGAIIDWHGDNCPTNAQVQQWYADYQEPSPRIAEIKNELATLDIKRIRPVAEGDTAYLATLNAQAIVLRTELQELL